MKIIGTDLGNKKDVDCITVLDSETNEVTSYYSAKGLANHDQQVRDDERKKVVEEIRKFIQDIRIGIKNEFSSYNIGKDSGLFQVNDFLDQMEKGGK